MVEVVPDKAALGKVFKKEAKFVIEHLTGLDKAGIESLEQKLEETGYGASLTFSFNFHFLCLRATI